MSTMKFKSDVSHVMSKIRLVSDLPTVASILLVPDARLNLHFIKMIFKYQFLPNHSTSKTEISILPFPIDGKYAGFLRSPTAFLKIISI